jgi:hypothetical protein
MKARHTKPAIVPDAVWPGMYRIRLSDGSLSDMLNLARARDALAWLLAAPRRTST